MHSCVSSSLQWTVLIFCGLNKMAELQQSGQYISKDFERLQLYVGSLMTEKEVDFFVSNLYPCLQVEVEGQQPRSLTEAINLACLFVLQLLNILDTTNRPNLTHRPHLLPTMVLIWPPSRTWITQMAKWQAQRVVPTFKCNGHHKPLLSEVSGWKEWKRRIAYLINPTNQKPSCMLS